MCKPVNRILLAVICSVVSTFVVSGCASVDNTTIIQNESSAVSAIDKNEYQYAQSNNRIGRHVYGAIGVGASRLQPDANEVPAYTLNDRVEPGAQITLGVDLSRQLSLELHSADLGSAGFSPTGRINYHTYSASALFYVGKNRSNYRRRGLSGYGRFGVGMLENSPVGDVSFVKDNATHVLFGAGLEHMTRMGLGLRAEVIIYEEDVQLAQLGLIYRMGNRTKRKAVEVAKIITPAEQPITPPVMAVAIVEPEQVPEPINPCSQFDGVLDGVNFHSNSEQLTSEATQILDEVSETLAQCESVPVDVIAHTDSEGSEAYNQSLSLRRAQSVMEYLYSQGIEKTRITAQAYGENQPIDTNGTAEGRSRNRRVELISR